MANDQAYGYGWQINMDHSTRENVVADERDWVGVDVDASLTALDAECERRIAEQFPGAEIHWIGAYERTLHERSGAYELDSEYDTRLTQERIWQDVQLIAGEVFNDGNIWMQELSANA